MSGRDDNPHESLLVRFELGESPYVERPPFPPTEALAAGELFLDTYSSSGDVRYLNAALKIADRSDLGISEPKRFAALCAAVDAAVLRLRHARGLP